MNELFDKLILRIVLSIFVCLTLIIYKYAHHILYPSARKQIFKRIFPSKNSADTIHLFARIIGIGIIYQQFNFRISEGLILTISDFLIQSIIGIVFYLISIYILESIVLYNFDYKDEIPKRKNMAYALISFSQSISLAYLIKTIQQVSEHNIVIFILLWLYAVVLIGFSTKSFKILSKLSLNKNLVQKNLAVSFSYMGFIFGWTVLIASSFHHQMVDIKWFSIQIILKILLSLIILPIFIKGIKVIFKLQNDLENENGALVKDGVEAEPGYGIYEGATFFTSCFLTTVITGNIYFGNFYPSF